MKKTIAILILLLATLISCKKEDQEPQKLVNLAFYSSDKVHKWALIWEGVDQGEAVFQNSVPGCNTNGIKTIKVSPGKHTYILKSLDGLAWGGDRSITIPEVECYSFDITK